MLASRAVQTWLWASQSPPFRSRWASEGGDWGACSRALNGQEALENASRPERVVPPSVFC